MKEVTGFPEDTRSPFLSADRRSEPRILSFLCSLRPSSILGNGTEYIPCKRARSIPLKSYVSGVLPLLTPCRESVKVRTERKALSPGKALGSPSPQRKTGRTLHPFLCAEGPFPPAAEAFMPSPTDLSRKPPERSRAQKRNKGHAGQLNRKNTVHYLGQPRYGHSRLSRHLVHGAAAGGLLPSAQSLQQGAGKFHFL